MAETQDAVGALFREGKLMPAIEAANAAVRKNPADLGSRILLAELLLFTGNVDGRAFWERMGFVARYEERIKPV